MSLGSDVGEKVRQTKARPRATWSDLRNHLCFSAEDPLSPSRISQVLVDLLTSKMVLEVTGTADESDELARKLVERAPTWSKGLRSRLGSSRRPERLNPRKENAARITRLLMLELVSSSARLLVSTLGMSLSLSSRHIRSGFASSALSDPTYNFQSEKRLDPAGATAGPAAVKQLESLRVQHLAEVRAIIVQ